MQCKIDTVSGSDPPCKNAYEVEENYKGRFYKFWCVDINSLEDLKALIDEVGESIVVGNYFHDNGGFYLTIYDEEIE